MPLHIQPKSLQESALITVTNLIIKSCVNIQYRFVSFDCKPCTREVNDLQNYLLPRVRPFLNHISDKVSHSDLYQLSDKRIFYALVVHSLTRVLNMQGLLSRDTQFCVKLISKVNNLVSLHICQEHISKQVFQTIANTCSNSLQEFTVSPVLMDFSDELLYLSKCKTLRIVKILGYTPMADSLKTLRLLITSLPRLEFFESSNMLKILSSVVVDYPFMSLRKLKEIDTKFHGVSNMIKICPKLSEIDIMVCSCESPLVLNTLANSSLPLKSLTIRGLQCQKQLDYFFSRKGAYLRNIYLDNTCRAITRSNIYVIGQYCPNLKTLRLDIPDDIETDVLHPAANDTEAAVITFPMFTKLEYLCFGWYKLDLHNHSILRLILCHANQLSVLTLQCSTLLYQQDALSGVLSSNPLTMLRKLSLVASGLGSISRQSLSCLIDRCQKLNECYIYSHIRRDARVFIQELYGRIQDENLDLQIDVFER